MKSSKKKNISLKIGEELEENSKLLFNKDKDTEE